VHGSEIAHRASQASREPGRAEAVGNGPQPDRQGDVLVLVVGDLARTWRKQRRKRGPSSRNGAVLQTTSVESRWKPAATIAARRKLPPSPVSEPLTTKEMPDGTNHRDA
jgi:hypothetical protein